MKIQTKPKNSIDIIRAKKWAKRYQKTSDTGAKAFLIPVIDLLESMEEMGVITRWVDAEGKAHYNIDDIQGASVRAYMAVDPDKISEPAKGEKLLIVGTKIDSKGIHRDIIEGEKSSECANGKVDKAVTTLTGSGVFDFTEPCPNNCDANSPLFNP